MKKIAILTSGFAPVPAVDNGAVEMLTTYLIEDNEKMKYYCFDVFTIADIRLSDIKYEYTNIIQIKVSKYEKKYEKIINSIKRRIGIKKLTSLYNKKLILELKKRKNYDFILFENSMDLIGDVKLIYPETRFILHLHNDLNNVSKTIKMAKEFIKKNSIILCVSNYIHRSLEEKTKEIIKKNILYNCIDFSKNKIVNNNKIREKLRYRDRDFVLLFVGRLNKEKGILELAKAFGKLKNKNIKLLICGGTWGSEYKENLFTKQIYKAFNQNLKNVKFLGYIEQKELIKYYSIADIVIIPSIVEEAFGMVMLEAAFYKKPIIASRSGGMQEIVSYENALWIDINDKMEEEIISKIEFAYSNYNFMKNKAERAYSEIISKDYFFRENYLAQFKRLIEKN